MEQRITIDTIYQKDFRVKNRGYDQEEVDKFLDDIIEEMERTGDRFTRKKLYRFMIRYAAPIIMAVLFLQSTGLLSIFFH